ncbi:hypothetical protein Z949_144 [Sulfitobacter guttiformis KCTC 32187]|nr:hypothetical protein Z949_144 [Sulfitobacter guttiformis KCTC 32187]
MLDCDMIHTKMSEFASCEPTANGLLVSTHCLYPSFEAVNVFVVGYGDGFIVHDNAEAARLVWMYGIDERSFKRTASHSANAFDCKMEGAQIQCEAPSSDWLWAAIASVANASSDAARAAVGKARVSTEVSLIQKAKAIFDGAAWNPETKLDFPFPGSSGKVHSFDLAIFSGGKTALVDAVTPHHNSIAAKYLAFSDTPNQPGIYKYALYDVELDQQDKALMSNVADLISYKSLEGTNGKFLIQ